MRLTRIEKTSLLLFGLAVVILVVLYFSESTGLIPAILILIAFASFIAGLFIVTFQKKEQVDAVVAGLISSPYMTTTSRLLADLGVSGQAHFIPAGPSFPSPVMQFNPVAGFEQIALTDDTSFYADEKGAGVLTIPSGNPLLAHLSRKKSMTVPGTEPELFAAIKETGEDLLEIADPVFVSRSGEEIVITLANYLLMSGCTLARKESPRVCLVAPCPVCSLFAMMLAMGTGSTVSLDQVMDEKGKLVIRIRQEKPERLEALVEE